MYYSLLVACSDLESSTLVWALREMVWECAYRPGPTATGKKDTLHALAFNCLLSKLYAHWQEQLTIVQKNVSLHAVI